MIFLSLHPSRADLPATQPSVQRIRWLFARLNQSARGAEHPPSQVTKLRMSGVIPSLSCCAYMAYGRETNFTSSNN